MSTISGTITHRVKLGTGAFQSPLTITATGEINPAAFGTNGIFVPATVQDGTITNAGLISGAFGGRYVGDGGIGVNAAAAVLLSNAGTILGGGSYGVLSTGRSYGGIGVDLHAGGTITNSGLISGGNGGNFQYGGGGGGIGVLLKVGTISNSGTILGGNGGGGYPRAGGNGGAGLELAAGGTGFNSGFVAGGDGSQGGSGALLKDGVLTNTGTLTGGGGIGTYYVNGTNGVGAELHDGAQLINSGMIIGLDGGYGHNGGSSGGLGVLVQGSTASSSGTISGGEGGEGGQAYGGVGGDGVMIQSGTLTVSGTVSGGAAGNGFDGGYGGDGVVIDGGTLTVSGALSGGAAGTSSTGSGRDGVAGYAVRFGNQTGTLVIDPGAVFNGLVVAKSNDALVLAGTTTGRIGGLGTQFTGFQSVTVDAGADWTLLDANTLLAGSVLHDDGKLRVTGTLSDAGSAMISAGGALVTNGSGALLVGGVSLSGGTLAGTDASTIAIGATLSGVASGVITVESGAAIRGFGSISGAPVLDDGTISAAHGTLSIATAVSGTGTLSLHTGAAVLAQEAVSGVSLIFAGVGQLLLGAPTSVTSTISGFGAGDTIDLEKLRVTSLSYAPLGGNSGMLILEKNDVAVGTLAFSGSYTAGDFTLVSDGHGGTDIGFAAAALASPALPEGGGSAWLSSLDERDAAWDKPHMIADHHGLSISVF